MLQPHAWLSEKRCSRKSAALTRRTCLSPSTTWICASGSARPDTGSSTRRTLNFTTWNRRVAVRISLLLSSRDSGRRPDIWRAAGESSWRVTPSSIPICLSKTVHPHLHFRPVWARCGMDTKSEPWPRSTGLRHRTVMKRVEQMPVARVTPRISRLPAPWTLQPVDDARAVTREERDCDEPDHERHHQAHPILEHRRYLAEDR